MSKSVLVTFNGYPQTPSAFLPDNGLASLAACLLEKGHDTRIHDYNIPETIKALYSSSREGLEHNLRVYTNQIANEILSVEGLDFVGFKLWTGDGFKASTYIATELKRKNPKLRVIAGGPHVDLFGEKIFQKTDAFDVLASGEGEETIAGYADYVDGKTRLEDIPNTTYSANGQITRTPERRVRNLNSLPIPLYEKNIYPSFDPRRKIKMLVSEWARGCPYNCNFCIHPSKSGLVVRSKIPERVAHEFEHYKKMYATSVFLSGDSDTPGKLLEGVAEELLRRGENIVYTATTHMNHVNSERLRKMKEAGFIITFYGMESGSQKILDRSIDKKLKVSTMRKAIPETKEAGITVFTSVIVPAPGETESTKKETLELLLETRPDYVPVNVPMIGPFSDWHDNAEYYGIKLGKDYDDRLMFFTPTLLLAPSQWNPLNYTIDGKQFSEIARESNDFAESLEEEGIVTQMSYDIVLMAGYAGIEPRTFRDKVRRILATGDYLEVERIIEKINQNIT